LHKSKLCSLQNKPRRKKEEGRRKKEEGRRKKEEGRRKKEEGRRKLPYYLFPNRQSPIPNH
jgi:hypothetical protein